MQGGEKDCAQGYRGTLAEAASSRDRGGGRDGKGGRDGTSTRPPLSFQQPGPRGVAPLRPSHSPGPSRQGLARPHSAPAHLPYLRRPPPCHPPQPRPVEKKWAPGPHALKLLASSLPRLPPLRLPAPGPGRPVPATAPPAWLHKVAEKPPPGPGLKGGAEGAPRLRRPCAGRPGLDGQRGGWQRGAHGLAPLSSRHPHPPTCLPDPLDRSRGAWVGGSGPSAHPLPPSAAHLTMKVNPSAARAPRLRQLVPSSGVRPESCAGHPLPGSSGSAPPGRTAPVRPSFCRRRRRRSLRPAGGRRLRCHRAPRPAPGLLLSLRTHFPPRPAEGSTLPRGPAPPDSAPRRPAVEPAGKRSPPCSSARHAGICSPAL